MKLVTLLIGSILLLTFTNDAYATRPQVAADAVSIKMPRLLETSIVNKSTEITVKVSNYGDRTVTLIAAISPYAVQTQLHEQYENQEGELVSRPAKVIEIKNTIKKDKRVSNEFRVKLIGLKRHPSEVNDVPITLVFDDGSYLRVNARVIRKVS